MDETTVIVAAIGVAGTLVGAVVGVGVAEILARGREREAETRGVERERIARVRAQVLATIDDTRRGLAAGLSRSLATAAGDKSGEAIAVGPHAYPRMKATLIDDVDVAVQYARLAADLATRAPRSGVTAADVEAVATAQNAIGRVLDEQERRALADESLHETDLAALAARPEVVGLYAALTGNQPASPER